MSDLERIGEYLPNDLPNNDNNVNNISKLNNDNNVNSRYALNPKKFIANTEESLLAKEIAENMNDLNNFAFYFSIVNNLGVSGARNYWIEIKNDILEKGKTKTPVRSPKKYFVWKYKRRHFKY